MNYDQVHITCENYTMCFVLTRLRWPGRVFQQKGSDSGWPRLLVKAKPKAWHNHDLKAEK